MIKDIPGFEGRYAINEQGEVYSLVWGRNKKLKTKIQNGYPWVVLCVNYKPTNTSIHRLVALTFIPNPLGLPNVHHKDSNRMNHAISNLEWVTQKQNIAEYIKKGRRPNTRWSTVLCLRTGIYYESISQACMARGLPRISKDSLRLYDFTDCGKTKTG